MKRRYTVVFSIEFDNPPSCFEFAQDKAEQRIKETFENQRTKVSDVTITERTATQ
jgi:hypothetical protein